MNNPIRRSRSYLQSIAPSSTPTATPSIQTRNPSDLLGVVPYLLGFHPHESLVMVVVRDRTVRLTTRVDLPPADQLEIVVERLGQVAAQQHPDGVILIAYGADADRAAQALLAATITLDRFGVIDALHADGRRWWSYLCRDPACCPPEGTPYQVDSAQTAAEAVFAGITTLPDRGEVAAQVSGPADSERPELERTADRASAWRATLSPQQQVEEMSVRVRDFLGEPADLSTDQCLELAVLAADLQARDRAWAMISRAEAALHLDLWRQVVRYAVAPFEPGPLCLLGIAAWVSGNGALQVCCIERVNQIDPGYSMTRILEDINAQALPPSFWDVMAKELQVGYGP